jgi:hypothetical protein
MGGKKADATENRERIPVFSTWKRLYAAVLLNMALQIGLFYLFTRAFQ